MSGAPSSSRRPQSIVRLPSRSSAQEPSSGSSYRPSRGETQVRASAATSSQHTDPQEEARDRSPAKERPRNRVNLSQRKDPGYVPPTGPATHVWAESSSTHGETASSVPRPSSSHSSE
ncbi:hypothetical protein FCV25MIE_14944 [Fagus crenata]